jgi:hypothetical protein
MVAPRGKSQLSRAASQPGQLLEYLTDSIVLICNMKPLRKQLFVLFLIAGLFGASSALSARQSHSAFNGFDVSNAIIPPSAILSGGPPRAPRALESAVACPAEDHSPRNLVESAPDAAGDGCLSGIISSHFSVVIRFQAR